jgi:hypothetical protein
VKANDSESAFSGIRDFSVARILPTGARWRGTIGKHLLDGIVAGTTIKLDVTDLCNLTQTEVRILGLQIHVSRWRMGTGRERW